MEEKIIEIIEMITRDLEVILEQEKMKTAHILNSLAEENKSSKEYVRAIDEVKSLMGIKDPISQPSENQKKIKK